MGLTVHKGMLISDPIDGLTVPNECTLALQLHCTMVDLWPELEAYSFMLLPRLPVFTSAPQLLIPSLYSIFPPVLTIPQGRSTKQ
jgi:hypothetical protein